MKRQVLFVQGGSERAHDDGDGKLVESLRAALGPNHEIRYPRMPNEDDPSYARWKATLEKEFAALDDSALELSGKLMCREVAIGRTRRRLWTIACRSRDGCGKMTRTFVHDERHLVAEMPASGLQSLECALPWSGPTPSGKGPMLKRPALIALVIATASCKDITAADSASVYVALTPKAGSAACVNADPEPAAVKASQGISFVNRSSVQLTLVLRQDNVPLVAVAPGDTSNAVKFAEPGIYQYYSQGCGSGSTELHTLSVTIN